jgi:hypothetical protein
MKLLKILGSIFVCLILVLVVLRITGLDPHGPIAGLWLKGNLVTTPVTDWSFVTPYTLDQVQTRSWYLLPHSVNTNFVVLDGQVYLTSVFPSGVPFPQGKGWTANVIRDPHVRLKFGNQLFDRRLLPVTDPATLEKLLQLANEKYPGMRKAYADKSSIVHFFQAVPQ